MWDAWSLTTCRRRSHTPSLKQNLMAVGRGPLTLDTIADHVAFVRTIAIAQERLTSVYKPLIIHGETRQ